jgi:hypothetical protein
MLHNRSMNSGHDMQTYHAKNIYGVVQSSPVFGSIEVVFEGNIQRTVANLRARYPEGPLNVEMGWITHWKGSKGQ